MFDISNRCEGNGLTSPAQDTSDVGSPTPLLERRLVQTGKRVISATPSWTPKRSLYRKSPPNQDISLDVLVHSEQVKSGAYDHQVCWCRKIPLLQSQRLAELN